MQPYKKSYMNVLDGLLLALFEFLILLVITFHFLLPSSNETLPLIIMIACGFPQLVLLLIVIYRRLKGKRMVLYVAHNVGILLKQTHTQNQAEDELSWANSLPHRLVNPNQYNNSSLSEHMPTLKHLQYLDKYHLCTLMVQSAREKDALHLLYSLK